MKVKRILSGLLAVAMVFSLTACSGIMEPKKNDGKKTVGIAMPKKTLERWNRDGACSLVIIERKNMAMKRNHLFPC